MDDLREARQRIRELVSPLRRSLRSYELRETLGYTTNTISMGTLKEIPQDETWHEDDVLVHVRLVVVANRDYPRHPYAIEDTESRIVGDGANRAAAIASAYAMVEREAVTWRAAIQEDEAYAASVGRRLRLLKDLTYVTGWEETGYVGKSPIQEVVPKGKQGVVVDHKPGWLYVSFEGSGARVPISTFVFKAAYFGTRDKTTGASVANWSANSEVVTVPDPGCAWES